MRAALYKALVIDFESVPDSYGGWFPVVIGIRNRFDDLVIDRRDTRPRAQGRGGRTGGG